MNGDEYLFEESLIVKDKFYEELVKLNDEFDYIVI